MTCCATVGAAEGSDDAVAALRTWVQDADAKGTGDAPFAKIALSADAAKAAADVLRAHHAGRIRSERAEEFKARVVRYGDTTMRYAYRVFGEKPVDGRSFYISMHGGGGTAARVNDQQWQNQIRLYEPAEGVYLAPRAPNDAWNMWHQGHIDPLFDRLIETMVVMEGVNPDRVYLMGYSAGGDGVYQLAPRMADRFAAASMMAGHPNNASPLGLRNLPFSIQVGGRDAAYKRNTIAKQWGDRIAKLQAYDDDGYEHWVKIYPNTGHWMNRKDAVAVPWMAKQTRRTMPKRIVWEPGRSVDDRFYWLKMAAADRKAAGTVTAEIEGQRITLTAMNPAKVTVRLSDAMLDLDKPIEIVANGKAVHRGRVQRTIGVVSRTLEERGDPRGVYAGEVTVQVPEK